MFRGWRFPKRRELSWRCALIIGLSEQFKCYSGCESRPSTRKNSESTLPVMTSAEAYWSSKTSREAHNAARAVSCVLWTRIFSGSLSPKSTFRCIFRVKSSSSRPIPSRRTSWVLSRGARYKYSTVRCTKELKPHTLSDQTCRGDISV